MSISRHRLSENMAFVSLKSSLRILWTATVALVFLTRSSAAPTFGGTDKAMVSLIISYVLSKTANVEMDFYITLDIKICIFLVIIIIDNLRYA